MHRPAGRRRWLADQGDEHRPLARAQVVDDPLRERLVGPGLGEVGAQEVRDHEPSVLEGPRVLECAGEQLQLRELHRFVDVPEDVVDVRACVDEIGGESQGLGRRVRILEAAGVRDDPDVERLGDLRRKRRVERGEQVGDDLGRRRGIRDDEVRRAEPRVVVVMVDIDDERGIAEHGRLGRDPALVGAVEREQDAIADIRRGLAQHLTERHEAVLGRERRRPRQVHQHVLARAPAAPGRRRASIRARRRRDSRA